MKLSLPLLVSSLAANVVLVGLVIQRQSLPKADATAIEAPTATAKENSSPGAKPAEPAAAASAGRAASAAGGKSWERVQTDDLSAMVARLRGAGFPEHVVRAILREKIRQQFADRRQQILDRTPETPYWRYRGIYSSSSMGDPAQRNAIRELSRETNALMKQVLGSDANESSDEALVWRRRQYGDLPLEKMEQLELISSDYQGLMMEVRGAMAGLTLPEDRQKLALLEAEKRKDLAAILTPEELEQYELRSSDSAMRARSNLRLLDVTEEQFKAVVALQKKYDEQHGTNFPGGGMIAGEDFRRRQEAEKQLSTDIKAALGEPLASQYDRARDYSYQMTTRLVARLDLPKETADQVWDLQTSYQAKANAIRTGAGLPNDERTRQLTALAEEAKAKLSETLTPRGFEAYRTSPGTFWLQNLTSAMRTTVTTGTATFTPSP